MTMTRSSDAGISQRTEVYAAKDMLDYAKPVMVLEKFGQPKEMPRNKSVKIKFRRPKVFTASTTPLQEGVTPTARQFAYEDAETTLRQYGDLVEITDAIDDTHEDPVLRDATTQCGENIGRTVEALNYGVIRGGTSVFYNNGAARNAVNTALSLSKQQAITRFLKAQKASKFTRILSGSPNFKTAPVEASFVAVGHTDCEADIRALPGFTPVAEYGTRTVLSEHEIGSCQDVRYILSPDLDPFDDAGGAKGTMKSTGGTNADVYPILYMGMNAWGHVALRGFGSIEPKIIPVGTIDKSDPLGQRGYVGWKTWHAALILNQLWMCRLEVAVTDL